MIETDEKERPKICIVKASGCERAKEMLHLDVNYMHWTYFPDSLLCDLAEVKEGYVSKQL
jgi:hypothetical protein